METLMILPGTTVQGSKYLGIYKILQSKSTSVAIDFYIFPTDSTYSLLLLFFYAIILQLMAKQNQISQFKTYHYLFIDFNKVFSIIQYSKYRMKRSSSSTAKQISFRRLLNKQSQRGTNNNEDIFKKYQTPSFGSQNFREETWNKTFKDFYKTFGCNDFTQNTRPSSKQTLRKCLQRPQTSKGIRNSEKTKKWRPQNKETAYYSQHIGNIIEQAYEKPEKQNDINIEIIVTKSQSKKGSKNKVRTKFETDLDDEFLQLFAN